MLKFIKHHMDTITGIGLYPMISFVLFFGFFLGVLLLLRKTARNHIDHMASLPLADENGRTEPITHAQH